MVPVIFVKLNCSTSLNKIIFYNAKKIVMYKSRFINVENLRIILGS
jgi:hypothetical protein